ncbi:zinc finger protein 1-like isoform X9 [Spodoptera litura]|uniref:Zinc finger protein 1-like isoform X9 n=1 Tax=Spodoptera litura TaxID=69820 RepID=A0A9J7ILA0_SPOLT|nr:zinc finger protein 1-like isoform X9 [Spodoptera litura]
METAGHSNMCRCCASEGAFKDIKSTYHWMGEEEIYADMLKDCFDINLNVSEHGEDGGICEVCITQLRNAINFKKQVQHTEEQFKKHLQNKALFRPNIVKVEVGGEEDSDGDNMGSGDDAFSGAEFDVPIKTEEDDPKPKKRSKASATTTRSKKSKSDDGEPSTKRGRLSTLLELESKNYTDETGKPNVKQRKKIGPRIELVEHRNAIREILLNCNATPIRKFAGIGYTCCYCKAQFPNPADLKTHTLDTHKDIEEANFMKTMIMSNYVVKLDITGLKCNVCNKEINTLDEFVDHCQKIHQSNICKDHLSHVLPFKFDSEGLRCMICLNPFDSFRNLIKHMHVHYRNYICPICDAGFVNKYALFYHTETHEGAAFICDYCPKIYTTHLKKRMHEKSEHSDEDKLNKCPMCEETFQDYVKKRVHLTSVHGIVASATACQACDKVVTSKKALVVHMRRVHLLEKPHRCDICDKKFYSTSCLKNHMIKHTGSKEFQCNICLRLYGRKKSLNAHLKTHDEGTHVKCEHCGQKFMQRYSLKCHIKSKHANFV